jgi:hypothetical protein
MAGIKLDLGALQKMLIVHEEALKEDKVKAFKKDGTKVKVEQQAKDDAIKALDAASKALSDVCQQGVLAIEVDPAP